MSTGNSLSSNNSNSTTISNTVCHDEDNIDVMVGSPDEDSNDVIIIDYQIVELGVKCSLLVSISIISSLVSLGAGLSIIQIDNGNYTDLSFLISVSDSLLNTICLCLLFNKNSIMYHKLCMFGHNVCKEWRIHHILERNKTKYDLTKSRFKELMIEK